MGKRFAPSAPGPWRSLVTLIFMYRFSNQRATTPTLDPITSERITSAIDNFVTVTSVDHRHLPILETYTMTTALATTAEQRTDASMIGLFIATKRSEKTR